MFVFITAIAGQDDSKYLKHLKPSIPKDSVSFVIGGDGSIAQKYNEGIRKYKDIANRSDKDIICFVHDDVKIVDEYFASKLDAFFNSGDSFKDVALAGVIGSLAVSEGCFWWEKPEYTKGVVIQHYKDNKQKPHLNSGAERVTISQALTVDGLAMFVPARHLYNVVFDETYGGYHFYDLDTCTDLANKNLRVFIVNVMLEHHSEGDSPTSPAFLQARKHYLEKYKFEKFPILVKQKNGKT